MKKYIKTERPNLFEPNVYISIIVNIDGTVTKEEVFNAVNTAYLKNEATMSKVILKENGEALFEKMNKSGCKVFFENREWRKIILESEKNPFAINEGEFIRTYIISMKQEITLLIMAHHLVGDGKAILVLLEDIVNSLDGKHVDYKSMELIDEKSLSRKANLPFSIKFGINKINHKWKKVGRTFTWEEYFSIHKKYWRNNQSDIIIKTYSATEMKKFCKNGVTLNSYLIAKLLQEYPNSKLIGIPVSIRENMDTISNQTSGITIKHKYNYNRSFEENLTKIHKKLYRKLQNARQKYFVLLFISQLLPSLIDAVLLNTHGCYKNNLSQKMAYIMGYLGKGGTDLGITNLMKINIPCDYEKFKIKDILFIPPKVSYAKNVIGISTYGDKLNVCYHNILKQ